MTNIEKEGDLAGYQQLLNTLSDAYPIGAEVPRQLNWTHLFELLKVEDSLERSFKYKFYMPDKDALRQLIEKQLIVENKVIRWNRGLV
jgi:hypothetical protein